MKKLITSILTIAMLASLASCGNTPAPANSDGAENSSTGSEAKTAGDGDAITLSFMGWEASELETKSVKNGIAKFEETHPNIKINYTVTGGNDDYNAKIMAAAVSGSAPDTFFAGAGNYRQYVNANILLDITDRFDSNFSLEDFIDSSRTIMTVDGHIYGISSCTVCPIVYYNKDVFDAQGVAYPDSSKGWSWEDFRKTAIALTNDKIYGVYGLETYGTCFDALLGSAGGSQFNEDYTKSGLLDDGGTAAKKVLQAIKSLREDDGAAPAASTLENAGMSAVQMLESGQVAMLVDGSWALQELSTLGFNIGETRLPNFGKDMTTGQAHLHAISATTKHADEAWEWLTFLSGMDYQGVNCSEGLWLPNRKSMWESGNEETGLEGWYDQARLGADYGNMIEYIKNAEVQAPAMSKTSQCADILKEELDYYFKENQDLDMTLQNIVDRQNSAIAETMAE